MWLYKFFCQQHTLPFLKNQDSGKVLPGNKKPGIKVLYAIDQWYH